MNKYAQIAIQAARYIEQGNTPVEAWEKSSCEIYEKGSYSQKKGCPKHAFLGLYGVDCDSKNAQYAIKALTYLKSHDTGNIKKDELWKIVL